MIFGILTSRHYSLYKKGILKVFLKQHFLYCALIKTDWRLTKNFLLVKSFLVSLIKSYFHFTTTTIICVENLSSEGVLTTKIYLLSKGQLHTWEIWKTRVNKWKELFNLSTCTFSTYSLRNIVSKLHVFVLW